MAGVNDLMRGLEALLFAADGPLSVEQIQECAPEAAREEIEATLAELRAHYDQTDRAVHLVALPGGWQLLTRPGVAPWVERLLAGRRRQRLSRAAVEVLAIVAYRQPVTRGEIEGIRGVDCGAVLHTLLDRKLVAIKGRARSVGHPLLYATTDRFLEHFGIGSLRELPKLEEFAALVDPGEAREELRQAGLLTTTDPAAPLEAVSAEGETVGAETGPGDGRADEVEA
jgi:segregation and condensation protein B